MVKTTEMKPNKINHRKSFMLQNYFTVIIKPFKIIFYFKHIFCTFKSIENIIFSAKSFLTMIRKPN